MKADHLRNETLWNISKERLCEIITFAPGILTTPASTTEQLWSYLDKDLKMDNDLIRSFIKNYPGYLRVNKETLALKVEYVVISEILLMASRSDLLVPNININKQYENKMKDTKLNVLRKLFTSMASKILEKSGMAFTCSLERIESRLLFVLNTKICPNLVDEENNDGDETQHPDAQFMVNTLTLKQGKPMWLLNKSQGSFEDHDPHIDGISFLKSVLSYERIVELLDEWEQINISGMLSSLPAPPSYCFLYTESKFKKWITKKK